MTTAKTIPFHAWTLRNTTHFVPEGMRGPNYCEHRIMVLGQSLIYGKRFGDGPCTYAITVYLTQAEAYQTAIDLTAVVEQLGYILERNPRETTRTEAAETYFTNRDGFVGDDPIIDAGFISAMRDGKILV